MDWGMLILLLAIILDIVVGDPDFLWRRLPHPVVVFGAFIHRADRTFNQTSFSAQKRKLLGLFSILMLIAFSLGIGYLIQFLLKPLGIIGMAIEIVLISIFIAQKSLSDHVRRVITPLSNGDIEGAKAAVSMIVGRETKNLDETGISRASIESLSENYSDGVVAPIFWCFVLGLPGLLAYKMLNTADSMIGHRNEKFEDFGWASAKLDDVANWLPARLSWLLITLSSLMLGDPKAFKRAFFVALDEAKYHRSPNAGWPEGAMAGALDIALSGPRTYGARVTDDRYLNEKGRHQIGVDDIRRALKTYWCACLLGVAIVAIFARLGATI